VSLKSTWSPEMLLADLSDLGTRVIKFLRRSSPQYGHPSPCITVRHRGHCFRDFHSNFDMVSTFSTSVLSFSPLPFSFLPCNRSLRRFLPFRQFHIIVSLVHFSDPSGSVYPVCPVAMVLLPGVTGLLQSA
jgi:hypothetical protein